MPLGSEATKPAQGGQRTPAVWAEEAIRALSWHFILQSPGLAKSQRSWFGLDPLSGTLGESFHVPGP